MARRVAPVKQRCRTPTSTTRDGAVEHQSLQVAVLQQGQHLTGRHHRARRQLADPGHRLVTGEHAEQDTGRGVPLRVIDQAGRAAGHLDQCVGPTLPGGPGQRADGGSVALALPELRPLGLEHLLLEPVQLPLHDLAADRIEPPLDRDAAPRRRAADVPPVPPFDRVGLHAIGVVTVAPVSDGDLERLEQQRLRQPDEVGLARLEGLRVRVSGLRQQAARGPESLRPSRNAASVRGRSRSSRPQRSTARGPPHRQVPLPRQPCRSRPGAVHLPLPRHVESRHRPRVRSRRHRQRVVGRGGQAPPAPRPCTR